MYIYMSTTACTVVVGGQRLKVSWEWREGGRRGVWLSELNKDRKDISAKGRGVRV